MELMPKDLRENIPDLYSTENSEDPICQIKLFTPDSNFTWYVFEVSKDDLNTCYGYVIGIDSELGYFTLEELKSVRGPLGLGIERDLLFKPIKLSEVKKGS